MRAGPAIILMACGGCSISLGIFFCAMAIKAMLNWS